MSTDDRPAPREFRAQAVKEALILGVIAAALSPLLAFGITAATDWSFGVSLFIALPVLVAFAFLALVSVTTRREHIRARRQKKDAENDAARQAAEQAAEAERAALEQAAREAEADAATGVDLAPEPLDNQNTAPRPHRPESGV